MFAGFPKSLAWTLLEIKDGIHTSRVVVARDKIPPHSSFKLQAIWACLKSFHWLMLPAKQVWDLGDTQVLLTWWQEHCCTCLCAPVSAGTQQDLPCYITREMMLEAVELSLSCFRPSLPTSKINKISLQKNLYSPFVSLDGSGMTSLDSVKSIPNFSTLAYFKRATGEKCSMKENF